MQKIMNYFPIFAQVRDGFFQRCSIIEDNRFDHTKFVGSGKKDKEPETPQDIKLNALHKKIVHATVKFEKEKSATNALALAELYRKEILLKNKMAIPKDHHGIAQSCKQAIQALQSPKDYEKDKRTGFLIAFMKTELALVSKKNANIENLLKEAVEICPGYFPASSTLGTIFVLKMQDAKRQKIKNHAAIEAILYCTKAIEAKEKVHQPYLDRGTAYLHLGKHKGALCDFRYAKILIEKESDKKPSQGLRQDLEEANRRIKETEPWAT
jgi:hypothetical protein